MLTFIASSFLQYAMKIERNREVRTVKAELKVLQRLQGCRPVCKLYDSGSEQGLYYFIMELLGHNLAETIQRDYGGCAPLTDVKILATGLLNALEGFHKEGFIHRDVKPANFALKNPTTSAIDGDWMLIDFGLARQYLDEKKEILPPRKDAGFRGSTTYASLNAHEDKDLGRRDDLWSWFYVLVEMIEGTLPWRVDKGAGETTGATPTPAAAAGNGNLTAKESVEERKKDCINHPERLFSKVLPIPPVIKEISQYLATLNFESEPNYKYLRMLLGKLDAVEGAEVVEEEKEKPDKNHHTVDKDRNGNTAKSTPTRAPLFTEKPRSRSLERRKDNNNDKDKDQRRERERSRDRDRGRSKDRSRKSRPRSHSRSRSRSKSYSRSRSRSRSGDRRRSRRRSHSRSRSRDGRRSRHSDRDRRGKSRSRSRSRSRSPARDSKKRRSGGSDKKNGNGGGGGGGGKNEMVLDKPQKKFENTMEFIGMLRSVSLLC
jgi:serine/threonine protein kinase